MEPWNCLLSSGETRKFHNISEGHICPWVLTIWILVHWPFWSPTPGLILLPSPNGSPSTLSSYSLLPLSSQKPRPGALDLAPSSPVSARYEGSFKKQQTFHSYETPKQLARVHLFCFRGRFMFFIKMWFGKIERALKMLLQWKKDKLEDIFRDQRQERKCAWALTKLDLFTPLFCKPGNKRVPHWQGALFRLQVRSGPAHSATLCQGCWRLVFRP